MNNVKYFICPMSKNIVDSIIELESDKIGITATRRQIDVDGGYVNGWTTKEFFNYTHNVSLFANTIIYERDHGGPYQGVYPDNGYESFNKDSSYFSLYHIDPWKQHIDLNEGIIQTIKYMRFVLQRNPLAHFEVGTEEDIRRFSINEIDYMLKALKLNLTDEEFQRIHYVVIQSGESLDLVNKKNKGTFNSERFIKMSSLCKIWDKKSKEHNGDFLTDEEYKFRFDNGLSTINIGPEFAVIETGLYLEHMTNEEIDNFYDICLKSNKWKRWVDGDVKSLGKKQLIEICGHYNYLSVKLPEIDSLVKETIKNKLTSLLNIIDGK